VNPLVSRWHTYRTIIHLSLEKIFDFRRLNLPEMNHSYANAGQAHSILMVHRKHWIRLLTFYSSAIKSRLSNSHSRLRPLSTH